MLNCYETQHDGNTYKGHRVAAKKNCFICSSKIFADTFYLVPMDILSYFHRQNPGYLSGRLLCNIIWDRKNCFHFL